MEIARNEAESALIGTLPEEMKKPDWIWLEENDDETGFTMEGLPFLEFYYPEDGELFLKLYYDEETGRGSGISYGYGAENNKIGFYFYNKKEWETDCVMIEIDYDYRDDGSIFSKQCIFDSWLFGTGESMRTIYYDRSGRAVYMEEYITHGDIQRYYIYEGDENIPVYCFVFDFGWDAFMVKYK